MKRQTIKVISLRLPYNLLTMVPVKLHTNSFRSGNFVSMMFELYSKALIKDDVTNLVIGTVKYKIIASKEISFSVELLI